MSAAAISSSSGDRLSLVMYASWRATASATAGGIIVERQAMASRNLAAGGWRSRNSVSTSDGASAQRRSSSAGTAPGISLLRGPEEGSREYRGEPLLVLGLTPPAHLGQLLEVLRRGEDIDLLGGPGRREVRAQGSESVQMFGRSAASRQPFTLVGL
ncbi:hypothetical protein ACWDRB_31180 [Nonomuraea sp. NPDC003707]